MSADATARQPVRLGAVEETLLVPLYARAVETRKPDGLLRDPHAAAIVDAIEYDFARFDGAGSLTGAVLRTTTFDAWARDFLTSHPAATVVEIGAGLNTRFERVDNGRVYWLDMELPEVAALRRRFFADSDRRTTLAASVLDPTWLAAAAQRPGPHLLIAEAVLLFLPEAQVREVLARIAAALPDARLAFDTAGRPLVDHQDEHDVMRSMAARFQWACDDPRALEGWGCGLRLRESRTLFDPHPALGERGTLRRDQLPEAPRRQVEAYRLNVFELAPR